MLLPCSNYTTLNTDLTNVRNITSDAYYESLPLGRYYEQSDGNGTYPWTSVDIREISELSGRKLTVYTPVVASISGNPASETDTWITGTKKSNDYQFIVYYNKAISHSFEIAFVCRTVPV